MIKFSFQKLIVFSIAIYFFLGLPNGNAQGFNYKANKKLYPEEIRHLLFRTSFAANESEIQAFAHLTRGQAVDRILSKVSLRAQTPRPNWVKNQMDLRSLKKRLKNVTPVLRQKERQKRREQGVELRVWWFEEMLTTKSPLTEKMTLFWHNHFTSGLSKVNHANLMYHQNETLRRHALGNFGVLLHRISKDPAMLLYLDAAKSRKGKPNENFAREVMELFTLGEGNYSEKDIQEAARAFTGWGVNRRTGRFSFSVKRHDPRPKTIFGKTGNFNGDDVLDLLLKQPSAAEFISKKLWKTFISPFPDEKQIKTFAEIFRQNRYEIKPLLRAMLISDAFYSKEARASLIKSPVELMIGTFRQFEVEMEVQPSLVNFSRSLGQDLFNPPNVKGWPGGTLWINSQTLLLRKQFLNRFFRADEKKKISQGSMKKMTKKDMFHKKEGKILFDSAQWMEQFEGSPRQKQKQARDLLLPQTPVGEILFQKNPKRFVHLVVLDPVYQLY